MAVSAGRNGNGLIVPTVDGDEWNRHDWHDWRRRVYRPAAVAAGVTGDLRPYRLRGSFVSRLLREGHSLAYVAEQAGHSIATSRSITPA
jgi:integrase